MILYDQKLKRVSRYIRCGDKGVVTLIIVITY